jgi:hypothetical protein
VLVLVTVATLVAAVTEGASGDSGCDIGDSCNSGDNGAVVTGTSNQHVTTRFFSLFVLKLHSKVAAQFAFTIHRKLDVCGLHFEHLGFNESVGVDKHSTAREQEVNEEKKPACAVVDVSP